MGALSDFWKQVDALAERERATWPKWFVWETEHVDVGADLIQAPTADLAREHYRKAHNFDGVERDFISLSCAEATPEQVSRYQKEMECIPKPTMEELKRTGWRPGVDP